MSTIFLFRHGQSEFNLSKTFTGWLDAKLTPLGIDQAKALGLMLKDKKINLAITSRLSRAQDTLKEVLVYHPECQQIIIDDRIIERSYGDLAGQTHADTIAKYGQEQFDKWHRGWNDKPPGGESFADVEIRVQNFIDDLKSRISNLGTNVAISAHGNSIRLFRKIMESATVDETCAWVIPYDSYFEYSI
ncbi:MAG: phosphoglycerate mutase family protein [Candidatus Shapirobacteria bacterium]|jgi:2,3-bisphosphoglycerate-dependent phosphoglycerate mutase